MTSRGATGRSVSRRSQTPAEKISNFFDGDWKKTRSNLFSRDEDTCSRSYNPSHSWDGRTDDSNTDHRLSKIMREVPTQTRRPIALLGSAVIPLELNTDGLAGICVQQEPKTMTTIPLTVEQQTIGMTPTLANLSIPLFVDASKANQSVVESVPMTFSKMQLQPPKFEPINPPSYLKDCGPQLDQKLLNPAQRREILEFEKKKFAADAYARQALAERSKVKERLLGMDYKRGAVGYDNAVNPESEIYGNRAVAYLSEKQKQHEAAEDRKAYLAVKRSSMSHSGNILNPDIMSDSVKTQKFYQNKGGNIHNPSFEETFFRVFKSNKEVTRESALRTQHLRDQDICGKSYDIVTHKEISIWPSNVPERVRKDMVHPSQTSLDGFRNMQGSTRPY